MAAVYFALEEENRRALRRERVFRDRLHPFDVYDDVDLIKRYRMPRPVLMQVVDLLHEDVAHPTSRSHAVPASLQVLSAIRYYATGTFQLVDGDTVNLSQPTISRIVTRVTDALASRARDFIKFPLDDASLDAIKEGFYTDRHRMPNVVGVVDGSLVQIKAPSVNEPANVCRKGFHAINVQGIAPTI
ncbi:putative nuclease HARBI1 [Lineus longissimus]|uniref:putative nuclease HARBI1 n=1 Tax=Lineus longissimus TaxID=88925 RepID=UPI00315C6FE2